MKTILVIILLLLPSTVGAQANEDSATLPGIFRANTFGSEYQGWNNCGPATLTNALVHFGYEDDQKRAAEWLKPNYEDKNVSPWQMVEFVNTQIPEIPVYAIVRSGGTREQLQTLMVNGFPVVIEKGYEPPPYDWMGHYLLLSGYDDSLEEFNSMDSFRGPNTRYSYEDIDHYWQHFNYKYIVLYTVNREEELMDLLGDDADEQKNHTKALEMARAEAIEDQEDAHAWFNMGSNFVSLGKYDFAARAYDRAISLGLPWRMFWYQFGTFEAYYHTERYDDMIRISRQNQNDSGGQYVEETYYYLGMAREGRGEMDKALQNYIAALTFNPNFSPAREARDRLRANSGPATLTNALVHFGYEDDQKRAAKWLKPSYEDKNVSPWQMVEFVNTQIPEIPVYAMVRSGGTREQLQTLMVNGFPVVIEKGYEPSGYDWMGHYLLLSGYDDSLEEFNSMDSYKGPNTRYSYVDIDHYWQHFNYQYIVLYTVNREEELMELLGDDADEWQNHINALEMARAEAIQDQADAHAWFNMGSNFVSLGMYDAAAQAYDRAISLGLPWRMFWYQFGTFEAYYHTERYDDMIRIARQNQNDGGGQYVEETYYYLGMAREGRGETDKALQNYIAALTFNPNFTPAREARDRLRAAQNDG